MSDPIKYMLAILEHIDQLRTRAERCMLAMEQKSTEIAGQLPAINKAAQNIQAAAHGLETVIAAHTANLAQLRGERRSLWRTLLITAGGGALLLFAAGFIVPVASLAARSGRPLSEVLSIVFGV